MDNVSQLIFDSLVKRYESERDRSLAYIAAFLKHPFSELEDAEKTFDELDSAVDKVAKADAALGVLQKYFTVNDSE